MKLFARMMQMMKRNWSLLLLLALLSFTVQSTWVEVKVNKATVPYTATGAAASATITPPTQNFYPTEATGDRDPHAFAIPRAWIPTEAFETTEGPASITVDSPIGTKIEHLLQLSKLCFTTLTAEYEYSVCPYKNATQNQLAGDMHVLLGLWGSWDVYNGRWSMLLTDGNPYNGGTARSIMILLTCDENIENPELSDIHELNARYYATLKGSFACDPIYQAPEEGVIQTTQVYPVKSPLVEEEEQQWILNIVAPTPPSTQQKHQEDCSTYVTELGSCVGELESCESNSQVLRNTVVTMQLCIEALKENFDNTENICAGFI